MSASTFAIFPSPESEYDLYFPFPRSQNYLHLDAVVLNNFSFLKAAPHIGIELLQNEIPPNYDNEYDAPAGVKQELARPCLSLKSKRLCECELCGPKPNDTTRGSLSLPDNKLVSFSDLSGEVDSFYKPLPQRKEKKRKRNQNWSPFQSGLSRKQVSFSPRSAQNSSNLSSYHHNQRGFVLDSDSEFPPLGSSQQNSTVSSNLASQETDHWNNTDPNTLHSQGEIVKDWGKLDFTSPFISDNTWDDMGLSSSVSTKPNSNKEVKDSNKTYHLLEEVRLKWEREQNDYRSQMSTTETPELAALVAGSRRKPDGSRYHVAGVDISFIKGNNEDACACLSVVRMPDLKLVYQRLEMVKLTQPYIPGFLAFREVPALEPLFGHLKTVAPQYWPDITLVDGNGKLHPRGFGLACHLGVILDIPTMGVAKSLISAQGISEDDEHKKRKRTLAGAGEDFDLISDSGEVLGKCLRVHDGAPNPMYISVGHKVSLHSAKWLALECSMYRIPEPVRRADLDSREYLRQGKTQPEEFILCDEKTGGWGDDMEDWQ